MSNEDPTSIIQMVNDLISNADAYRRNSGVSLRLSGAGVPMALLEEDETKHAATPSFKRKRHLDDSTNSSMDRSSVTVGDSSLLSTCASSPWEWRRLKGEVLSLRTRLSHQEANVQQLHKIRRQMEEVFDKERNILESQAELDRQTIKQLEARIDVTRRTCQEAREARTKAEKDLVQMKTRLEAKIVAVINENARIAEGRRQTTANANLNAHESVTVQRDDETWILREKFKAAEERIAELEEKLRESQEARRDAELCSIELQNARIKLENLESERASWEEGKLLSAKAMRASDLERELEAARDTIASMRESVKGKLLLEEEMCNLRQRIAYMDKLEERIANLETERSELLRKLSQYESLGFDDANALNRELNRLQQSETVLFAEEGQLRSKIDSLQREHLNLTKKYEEAKKLATEMSTSTDRLNKLVGRLQKKMILVTRERDSYRQQLDLYEKEITVTVDNNSAMNERIPDLERALEGYRDLVSKLEAELRVTESGVDRDECEKLREEIERLKGELEHRALKGDFNCDAKILHFSINPAAIASKLAEEKQQALLREIEELRAHVQVGSGASVTGVSSLHSQEIAELKQTHEIKIGRLKDAFRIASQEYRQACYQLFGWRVDRTKEGEYKLSSQYADSPDDFLFFHVGAKGVDLIETDFSATLGSLIERHLEKQHSVPMFINAVQCDLFAQQTATNVL